MADDFPATTGTNGSVSVNGNASSGSLQFAGDADYFNVRLTAGKTYVFDLSGAANGTLTDTYLSLMNPQGSPLAFDDDKAGSKSGPSRLAYTPTEGGTYYLAASSDTNQQGSYLLSAVTVDDDLPASRSTHAAVTVNGDGWSGTIDYEGDTDYVKVDLRAGTTYALWVRPGGVSTTTLEQTALTLRDGSGAAIGSASGSKYSRMTYAPTSNGTYYIEASGLGDYPTGDYVVAVTSLSDDYPASDRTTGRVLPNGEPSIGGLEIANDVDWFRVSLTAGMRYVFDLAPDGSLPLNAPRLSLYGTDRVTVIASNTYGGDSEETPRAARIELTPTVSGTYYLDVTEYYGGIGTYSLHATSFADTEHPSLASTSPVDNAQAVPTTDTLVLTFSELVHAGEGSVVIRSADGADIRTIDIDDDTQLQLEGQVLTIDPIADLEPNTSYHVDLPEGIVVDGAGNAFEGLVGSGAYNFRTTPDDYRWSADTQGVLVPNGPTIAGGLEVAGDRDLFRVDLVAGVTYDMHVSPQPYGGLAGGDLALYGAELQFLARIENNGSKNAFTELRYTAISSGSYYLGVHELGQGSGGYFVDVRFVDQTPPMLLGVSPSDDATDVPRSGRVTFSFDENIAPGTGAVELRHPDGSVAQLVDIRNSAQAIFSGHQLIIDPVYDLQPGASYALVVPAGAVVDGAGNAFAGMPASAGYSFTTLATNSSPQASDLIITLPEDTEFHGALPAAFDVDGDSISYSLPAPGLGALIRTGNEFVFRPVANASRTEEMTYTVTDSQGASSSYRLSIQVIPVHDHFIGTADADHLQFDSVGPDTYELAGGDDWVFSAGSGDLIDGGAGRDSVSFERERSSYTVAHGETGWTVSTDGVLDASLTGVERAQFSNDALAIDVEGAAGAAAKLVGALFGSSKLADFALVGLWLARVDASDSFEAVLEAALDSPPFLELAGSRANADFVDLVFTNLVGRAPDAAETAHFVGLLDSGAFTQTSLAALACETEMNLGNIDFAGLAETGLVYLPY
ncbi:MAG TPA: Ig-like domain-containing protein [Solimonas sp.]|nr:Ig-like domain-containing protein [Solimonas sp.]